MCLLSDEIALQPLINPVFHNSQLVVQILPDPVQFRLFYFHGPGVLFHTVTGEYLHVNDRPVHT